MGDQTSTFDQQVSGRLRELEQLSGALLARRTPQVVEVIDDADVVRGLVPVPRRSRIFLRHAAGHGTFADLTVTAPPQRHTTD
ncbi:hypothetical protein [Nocardioides zeicaulis]|uniref:Uncharacterized protein n=1 Tax=Nocardioides zeicaulis TaxID=1776857 RepID=A0ABV6E0V2_9ACTN